MGRPAETANRELSTRRRIVMLMKKNSGPVSVQLLAQRLGLSGMAVRRHLYALQKDRYIHTTLERKRVGRPLAVYQLTAEADALFPDQYCELALDLVGGIDELFGSKVLLELMERRANRLERHYRSEMEGEELERRLEILTKLQNKEGYMAVLKRNEDGSYLLEEENCPIAEVAMKYRYSCQCELAMFNALLPAEVRRTACMAEGDAKCSYFIKGGKGP